MENIKHIVYLMLENRSLDNVLGWLYEKDNPVNFIPKTNTNRYDGLQTGNYFNPDGKGGRVRITQIKPDQGQQIPSVDPHEKFAHVQTQIETTDGVKMGGFYIDFSTVKHARSEQIMETYTPESLPVLNSLAKQYAVSDAYFSSIPTQTNCNRAFSLTGNSIGSYHDWPDENKRTAMVNNYWEEGLTDAGDPYVFSENSIWNVLNDHKYDSESDWMVFYHQTWPGIALYEGSFCFTQDLLYPKLKDQTSHFKDISQFFRLAQLGQLPTFSYLEPTWYEEKVILGRKIGHNGDDYHPPSNVACGEQGLYELYDKLKKSPT